MFPLNKSARTKKCLKCYHTHGTRFNCSSILCLYCYQTHKIQELHDGLCPEAYLATEHLRKPFTLVCPDCKGLGKYTSTQNKIIRESEEEYKKRLEEWAEEKKKNCGLAKPERMEFRDSITTSRIIECQTCSKNGIVEKYTYCCYWGCEDCKFTRAKTHPSWQKLKKQSKKQPVTVKQENITCTICTEPILVGHLTYPTECGHMFHNKCILKWYSMQNEAKNSITCPVCRKIDSYFPAAFYDPVVNPQKYKQSKKYYHQENMLTKYENSRSRKQRLKRYKEEGQKRQISIIPVSEDVIEVQDFSINSVIEQAAEVDPADIMLQRLEREGNQANNNSESPSTPRRRNREDVFPQYSPEQRPRPRGYQTSSSPSLVESVVQEAPVRVVQGRMAIRGTPRIARRQHPGSELTHRMIPNRSSAAGVRQYARRSSSPSPEASNNTVRHSRLHPINDNDSDN